MTPPVIYALRFKGLLLGMYDSPREFHKPRVVVEVRKLARMDKDDFSVVEDYLQYP